MWRALLADALSVLKRTWPDIAIISVLGLLSMWVRRLTLLDIEGGGDAVRKWFFVKQWLYSNSFAELEWNHHLARFGINLWAFLAQLLGGSAPGSYYFAPVAAATAAAIFTYKLGQQLAGRYAGTIAAVWLITMEPMERAGSQLLPAVFEAAYIAGAAYFLLWYLRYTGARRWQLVLLVVTGLFLFFAYLAKVSNLLFVPGFVLAVWLVGGRLKDALILLGMFVGLFLLETAWYLVFTEYSTRFEIISESHRGGTVRDVMRTVIKHRPATGGGGGGGRAHATRVVDWVKVGWKLLERYQVLWESIKFPLFVFFGTSLGLAVFAKHKQARALSLLVFGFLCFATFSIRQLHPLKVWMSNEPRYMIVLCPLLFAMNAAFAIEVLRRGRDQLSPRIRRWLLPLHGRFAPLWALAVCGLVAYRYYDVNGSRYLRRGFPLRHLEQFQQNFSKAYATAQPITEKRSRNKKALRLIYSVLLPEAAIARGDRLPAFEEAVRVLDSRYDWLSKDPGRLREAAREQLRRNRKCVYVGSIRGRYLQVRPAGKLPDSCFKGGAKSR